MVVHKPDDLSLQLDPIVSLQQYRKFCIAKIFLFENVK